MSRTGGGESFLIGALVVSVLAHIGLMIAIRPQVMTRYSEPIRHSVQRRQMQMRETKEIPESIRMAVLKDLAPLRDSPEAVSAAMLPSSSSLDSPLTDGTKPPAPAEPEAALPVAPIHELAPKFSESIALKNVPSFVTPLAAEAGLGITPPAARPTVAPVASAATVADEVAVPQFAAPAMPPMTVEETASVLPSEPDAEQAKSEFKPSEQVMAEVDEGVVAAEKNAVRDLLNVRDTKELVRFVTIDAFSAATDDWTYFRVKVNPLEDLRPVPKDVVILMDASGSIANDRLKSCRSAAKEILRSCMNSDDRFNLVAFRDSFEYAFKTWRPCDKASYDQADRWMNNLAAHGRTDVFATIASVLKLPRDPKRPLIALVVTDGDANTGVKETAQILSRFSELNDGLISVYMYGVKSSANRELIDVLTRGNRGESFIYEGNRKYAGRRIEELSQRFCDPVLSDLRVVFTSNSKAEAYPRLLRNLYRGQSVELVGRVPKGTRDVAFSLKGLNGSRAYEGFFRVKLSAAVFDATLPSQWAAEQAIDVKLR